MKLFHDILLRTLNNGTYAAVCGDTSIIDNYHRVKRLTDIERDALTARWLELNPPAEADPEEPAGDPVAT